MYGRELPLCCMDVNWRVAVVVVFKLWRRGSEGERVRGTFITIHNMCVKYVLFVEGMGGVVGGPRERFLGVPYDSSQGEGDKRGEVIWREQWARGMLCYQ